MTKILTNSGVLAEFLHPREDLFVLCFPRGEVCGQSRDNGHQTSLIFQAAMCTIATRLTNG